jgi:hypothetical protein
MRVVAVHTMVAQVAQVAVVLLAQEFLETVLTVQ